MEKPLTNVCLSFSCPMKWSSLQQAEGNQRFCVQCQHSVTDFTQATEHEFKQAMAKSSGRLCGRFKASQMSAAHWARLTAAAMTLSVLACTPEKIQPPDESLDFTTIVGDVTMADSLEGIELTGIVFQVDDEDSVTLNSTTEKEELKK
ncbi:MAG: hypothetical protein HYZ44_06345 [Bacteroidetes bacterium]|nr:hypothetical protein [Bacteroidota bacterium]